MDSLLGSFSSKIPDFHEIIDIFNHMVEQHGEDTAHIEDTRKT